MHPKFIVSPETVVPENAAALVFTPVSKILLAVVVKLFAQHDQPFAAVGRDTVKVQVPVVPDTSLPAVPPPANDVAPQPFADSVNVVPHDFMPCPLIKPLPSILAVFTALS